MFALSPLQVVFWPFMVLWELVITLVQILTGTQLKTYLYSSWTEEHHAKDWLRIGVFLIALVGVYFSMPPKLLEWKPAIVGVAWLVGLLFAEQKIVVLNASAGSKVLWTAVYYVLLPALFGVMIATLFVH